MTLEPITYTPIGVVHSPFTETAGMPIQSVAATGISGSIELDSAYRDGLKDLEQFSHLILLTHLHRVSGHALEVVPFLDDRLHGIFATRSPKRPNPIGLSIVRLVGITSCILTIEEVDVVDGTPLLDMKPYIPAFDCRVAERIGWFARRLDQVRDVRADDRFTRG